MNSRLSVCIHIHYIRMCFCHLWREEKNTQSSMLIELMGGRYDLCFYLCFYFNWSIFDRIFHLICSKKSPFQSTLYEFAFNTQFIVIFIAHLVSSKFLKSASLLFHSFQLSASVRETFASIIIVIIFILFFFRCKPSHPYKQIHKQQLKLRQLQFRWIYVHFNSIRLQQKLF